MNLLAGSRILAECHARTGGDWGKAFSCYYSGDTTTGFRHGYVQKVFASMRGDAERPRAAIRVIGKPIHKVAGRSSDPARRRGHVASQTTAPAHPAASVGQVGLPAPDVTAITWTGSSVSRPGEGEAGQDHAFVF